MAAIDTSRRIRARALDRRPSPRRPHVPRLDPGRARAHAERARRDDPRRPRAERRDRPSRGSTPCKRGRTPSTPPRSRTSTTCRSCCTVSIDALVRVLSLARETGGLPVPPERRSRRATSDARGAAAARPLARSRLRDDSGRRLNRRHARETGGARLPPTDTKAAGSGQQLNRRRSDGHARWRLDRHRNRSRPLRAAPTGTTLPAPMRRPRPRRMSAASASVSRAQEKSALAHDVLLSR